MKKNILFITISLIILIGCSKEESEPDPLACFTLSSTSVDLNEVITSSNCSSNAFSYLWNDGGGNQSTLKEPTFYYSEPGNYLITLTVYSESGKKQNTAQQSVIVIQMTGQISFWQSGTPAYGITTVTIGQMTNQITLDHPNGITDCNQTGCANFTLPTGDYTFSATDGTNNWNGSFTIEANSCLKFQLQ